MKFPITRETLQEFDQKTENAERREKCIQLAIENDVKAICNEVEKGMLNYSREKRFIWRNNMRRRDSEIYMTVNGQAHITINDYLPQLIEKLKETFIGCDIISDPLNTYIVIGWL